CANGMSGLDYW
nr:immunoglobulin heavy chain junction region [Macaca mulatta]MOX59243.1 immunoglobulin heavy chain junction region [Macaca mulatta]MOX60562.1 immunoglobulin heavy chain junction region [Macaca mulatta]MOX61119.1 immunoglobulin heavy chain junction region [Macaca mulatta]MOX61897.1 immunoglobulin heavy chain junction region [Macaca mulatta]